MPYTATIRDTRTGETVRRRYDDLEWDENSEPWWGNGNFSCDCNRQLEFRRAKGENPGLDSTECGEGRFKVLAIVLDDGQTVYSDDQYHGGEDIGRAEEPGK